MKRLFLICVVGMLLASCNDYRTYCDKDEMYHRHSFSMVSIETSYELGHNGWYTERCKNCGLEKKWNVDYEYPKHYGTFNVYRSPKTGNYDDYCIIYNDPSSGKEVAIHVNPDDVVYKKAK